MSLRPGSRLEERKKGYKLAVDAEEARRKREDNMVEIRKNKREESLLKKRREGLQVQSMPPPTPSYSTGDRKVFYFHIYFLQNYLGVLTFSWEWETNLHLNYNL